MIRIRCFGPGELNQKGLGTAQYCCLCQWFIMWLLGKVRRKMVRELVAPTKIPAVLPASCAADPTIQEALIGDCPNALESKAQLALNLVENELHDIMRSTCSKEPMGGRANGPVFRWKPALGRVGSHQPKLSPVSVAWSVVASALKKMLSHWQVQQSGQGHRATVIKARATILTGSWKHLGVGTGAKAFRWWIRNLDHQVLYSLHAIAQLSRIVSKIAEAAKEYDLNWLREGPAAGLGRQHHMSRVAGGWIPSRVAMVKVVDDARGADPEQSWQQDLEDLPEEYVVQQANITSTVAFPLDKQQTVDLEADRKQLMCNINRCGLRKWGSSPLLSHSPRSRTPVPPSLRKLDLGGTSCIPARCCAVAIVSCSCSSRSS